MANSRDIGAIEQFGMLPPEVSELGKWQKAGALVAAAPELGRIAASMCRGIMASLTVVAIEAVNSVVEKPTEDADGNRQPRSWEPTDKIDIEYHKAWPDRKTG